MGGSVPSVGVIPTASRAKVMLELDWCPELVWLLHSADAAARGHPHAHGCLQAKGTVGCSDEAKEVSPWCGSMVVVPGYTEVDMVCYTPQQ